MLLKQFALNQHTLKKKKIKAKNFYKRQTLRFYLFLRQQLDRTFLPLLCPPLQATIAIVVEEVEQRS